MPTSSAHAVACLLACDIPYSKYIVAAVESVLPTIAAAIAITDRFVRGDFLLLPNVFVRGSAVTLSLSRTVVKLSYKHIHMHDTP